MNHQVTLILKKEPTHTSLQLPCVAEVSLSIAERTPLNPNMQVGTAKILGQKYALMTPSNLQLSYAQPLISGSTACGYASSLITVHALDHTDSQDDTDEVTDGLQGLTSIPAPIDGTVYYAPNPESPPFVEEGSPLIPGQVIALIEVMKFFYEIPYEGPTGKVAVRRGVDSGSPIEAGSALWWYQS